MDHREAGRYWEANAEAWTRLARGGWDVYRDLVNTPAFFELLPDVSGLRGLDVGCGEGYNTRLLAERGAVMCAVDISPRFVREARAAGDGSIQFAVASGQELPFADCEFDFATSFMCLMDLPKPETALRECQRVLRPGGFLQYSISHPCFNPPWRKLLRTEDKQVYALEVGRYFERIDGEIDTWLFAGAPPQVRQGMRRFEIPRFHRTLAEWINLTINAGFTLERVGEPRASEETVERFPAVADTRVAAYFLHLRCRKVS